MGSLAGSSGVAYSTSHRSPLSYNIDITKSSPMTELSFGKFGERGHENNRGMNEGVKSDADADSSTNIDAREVLERHNASVSSFYKEPVTMTTRSHEDSRSSYYDELIQQLSKILERNGGGDEDMSDISGDTLSQFYYYGITAVLLYLLYRILYVKRK